jgi:hypothetical protein
MERSEIRGKQFPHFRRTRVFPNSAIVNLRNSETSDLRRSCGLRVLRAHPHCSSHQRNRQAATNDQGSNRFCRYSATPFSIECL